MKQKQIEQPFLVSIIENLVERVPIYKRGTYNEVDPTCYSKGRIEWRGLYITTHDVTWGIEIEVTVKDDRFSSLLIANIYLSYERKFNRKANRYENKSILIPRTEWGHYWFKIFKKFNSEVEPYYRPENDPNYEPDPMGSLSDYE